MLRNKWRLTLFVIGWLETKKWRINFYRIEFVHDSPEVLLYRLSVAPGHDERGKTWEKISKVFTASALVWYYDLSKRITSNKLVLMRANWFLSITDIVLADDDNSALNVIHINRFDACFSN